MKTARLKKILTAAAGLPARQARRVLAAVLAKQEAPDSLDEFRAALSEDLKPLGDALWSASQAGDFPAMQAALRKISTNMTDFMGDAQAMADALSGGLLNSYLGEDVISGKGTSAGAFKGWITRRRNGLTPKDNRKRAGRLVEWAMKAKRDVPNIGHRKGLGWIDLPWGRPGHKAPVVKTDKAGKPTRVTHTDGYGLSHILDKHGWSAANAIPGVIAHGKISRDSSDPLKAIITHGGNILILGKENKDSSYAISSFDRNEHSELPNLPVRPEVKPQPLSHVRIKRRERQTKTSSTK